MTKLIAVVLFILASIQMQVNELNNQVYGSIEKITNPDRGIVATDSLPNVFKDQMDIKDRRLRTEAVTRFMLHQLPDTPEEWESYQTKIKEAIITGAGVEIVDQNLDFNLQLTDTIQMEGYKIKNIAFQTLPGVYATANLYVPAGDGPFPAVLTMMGHWEEGKIEGQEIGHTLALNGYVGLVIDPWGAGERTTTAGEFEYHGGNLGSSLMNVGRSLLGIQISDNMRAVDFLSSLPYVDADKIGATGASGGGNQTMWLSAIDERIKATVPVVSVGTFDSYILGHNCICEVLIDGLMHTEASGVIALIAPRALKMHNHTEESNPTFFPEEMLRSYKNAKPVFEMLGAEDHISYDLYDLTHGYYQENREGMLGWFDLHLKGKGSDSPKQEIPFGNVEDEKLLVYPAERFNGVKSTANYNLLRGQELRDNILNRQDFDSELKKNELREILRISEKSEIKEVYQYSSSDGWDRFSLKTTDLKLIPLLHRAPRNSNEYVIIVNPTGKKDTPSDLLDEWIQKGAGIVLVDLSGTGEVSLSEENTHDGIAGFHTLSRARLWLGRTMLGEWVKELDAVAGFLKSKNPAADIKVDGSKEAGLAALFLAAVAEDQTIGSVTVRETPVSYLFDSRENIDFFTMAIHLPGILEWGDVSMAAGLSDMDITFINPVSMSGRPVGGRALRAYKEEFQELRSGFNNSGRIDFIHK